MKLKDKVVLVTGGAQGIGKEICITCAREGAKIVVNYVDFGENETIAKATKEELEALGATVMLVQANIASFEETKTMFKTIIKEFGRIDVLVNNAGITKDNLLMRMKESDFDAVIDVNLKGTWNCMKHAAKFMMKQRYGRIISMSSVVGVMGNAGQVNYSASKAGIIGMTMSLAREVGSRGITVNAIAPGFIQTAMTDVLPDEIKENMAKQIPLGTFGQVSDIANTVVFLASDDARYITGQTIHVDGGMAM
ncbi:3-oxoacyl-[acyl-carrier-protein] reductase [Thomasclavelia cocleata]|uniref:3-oxoacyl-[acyl-carrier-protein] reductase n=1 Tax=Thomasclavelia cocleata TaxID=69824 RepID=UPI002577F4DD|nr:3-oxoacyl-[acyl-carrier-protein] reductase [Thomasclavelia cocleata]